MRRLTRDRVVSVVEGKEIVGVYWEDTDVGSPTTRRKKEVVGSEILFECNSEAADQALKKLEQRHLDGYHAVTSSFDL